MSTCINELYSREQTAQHEPIALACHSPRGTTTQQLIAHVLVELFVHISLNCSSQWFAEQVVDAQCLHLAPTDWLQVASHKARRHVTTSLQQQQAEC
jgi:hypothetical protein